MRLLACLMMLSLTACASVPAANPVCTITEAPRTALAGALVDDGGPRSQRAGLVLVGVIDGECGG